jgi:hypothetical protein
MADGVADVDVRFADEELAICEFAPAVIDGEFVRMEADASQSVEEFAAEPGSNGEYSGELEQPYFVDWVMETEDPYIVCTLYDGPIGDEVFMTMDVVDDEPAQDGEVVADGKVTTEWYDYEISDPIIYTMVPVDSGEEIRGDDELPVDEVVDDPMIITMVPEDSGEVVKGEESEASESEVEDPIVYTMDDVDVVIDRETPAEPALETEDPEIVTFGNDGEAAENGPAVDLAEEVPSESVRPRHQVARPRVGRNRGLTPTPEVAAEVESPILAVVTRMDNRGRMREVQVEMPATESRVSAELDLEPLDTAFSLLRGGRLNQRLGGRR